MTAELLKQAFDRYYQFSLPVWESTADFGEVISLDREQVIKKAERTESHLYLIIEGSGGILLWHKNNFICTDMLFEGEFLCDFVSN